LIFNPEVLAVHMPTLHFDLYSKSKIIACLRKFVDDRGLCKPAGANDGVSRRPRTCVFTTGDPKELQDVDYVVSLESDQDSKRLTDAMSPEMLRKGPKTAQLKTMGARPKAAEEMNGDSSTTPPPGASVEIDVNGVNLDDIRALAAKDPVTGFENKPVQVPCSKSITTLQSPTEGNESPAPLVMGEMSRPNSDAFLWSRVECDVSCPAVPSLRLRPVAPSRLRECRESADSL